MHRAVQPPGFKAIRLDGALAGRIRPGESIPFVLFHETVPAEILDVDKQVLAVVARRRHDQAVASQVVQAVGDLLSARLVPALVLRLPYAEFLELLEVQFDHPPESHP